MFAIAVISRE